MDNSLSSLGSGAEWMMGGRNTTIGRFTRLRERVGPAESPIQFVEEYQCQDLINLLPQAVWTATPDGSIDFVNQYAQEFTGATAETLFGSRWLEYVHPDDRESVLASWTNSIQTGQRHETSYRVRDKTGRYHWVQACGIPLRSADGQITKWIGLLAEIDNVKQTEEALRVSEEYNRQIVESSQDCIKTLDLDGHLLSMNAFGQGVFGISDILPYLHHPLTDLLVPEDRPKLTEAIAQARAGGVGAFQACLPGPEGTVRWFDVHVTPIRNPDGKADRLLAVSREVTGQKQHQEVLREWEERFRLVVDVTGALVFDIAFDFSQLDPTHGLPRSTMKAIYYLSGLLGYEHNEIPETFEWWIDQIHPDDQPAFLRQVGDAIAEAKDFIGSYRIRHKESHYIVVDTVARAIRDLAGQTVRFVGAVRDITARKNMEEALRQQEERFRLVADAGGVAIFDIAINLDRTDPVYQFPDHKVNAVRGLLEMLGYHSEEIPLTLDWWMAQIHPDDLPMYVRLSQEGFVTLKDLTLRYRIRHKEGHYLNVEQISRIVRDSGGRPVRLVGGIRDVTAQTKMEQALRESEEKFRSLAESADAPVGIIQGRKFVYANPYLIRLSGYTPKEFYDLDILNLVHPDFRPMIAERYQRRLTGDTAVPVRYEYKMLTKAGEEKWMDVSPVRIELKGVPSVIGIALDITDRKRTEDALRRSNEGLRLLAEVAARLLVEENPQQVVEALCRRVMPVLGCDLFINFLAEESKSSLRLHAHEGLPPEVVPAFGHLEYGVGVCGWTAQNAARAVAEHIQDRWDPRADLLRPLGLRAYASHPLISRDGRVIGTLSFGSRTKDEFTEEDLALMKAVTDQVAAALERMRTEQALRDSEGRLRAILQNTPAVAYLLDRENRYIFVNRRFEELFNVRNEDLRGQALHTVLPLPVAATLEANNQRVIQGGTTIECEESFPHPDGSVHVYASVKTPLINGDGRPWGIVGVSTDITDRKQMEETLKGWNEELEQRVRERTAELREAVEELKRSNDDLEKFAYISSHDLQEPLRMIGSYVGLLALNYKDKLDEDARTFIGYAEEGAVRMSNLIKDLLAYSRVNTQGQNLVPTDTTAIVDQVLQNLRLKIEETGATVTRETLPTVLADASQLTQVFQNLIENALKFRKENEPPRIHMAAEQRGDQWLFSVRDNGIGVEPRHQEQIFVAFKRLHTDRARYPGSGIGLAVVKRIVERHHGRICVDSDPGKGTTFYFTLPVQPPGGTLQNTVA